MHSSDIIPALDFEKSLPPHYLRAWNRFLQSLRQTNVSTIDRDRLVRAILPIFHHPHIKAPMRILLCEKVKKLAGLHNHFDRVQAHRSLLTEFTVRNYCGNFHPEYIQAAVGHPNIGHGAEIWSTCCRKESDCKQCRLFGHLVIN